MRRLRTLKPGEWGTKGLLARHGASLLWVRYRYDGDTREHLKTVGLIVQRRVKSAAGQWVSDRRVWFVRRDVAERLDLLGRVVGGGV